MSTWGEGGGGGVVIQTLRYGKAGAGLLPVVFSAPLASVSSKKQGGPLDPPLALSPTQKPYVSDRASVHM